MSTTATDALRPGAVMDLRAAAARRDGERTALDRAPRVNPWRGDAPTATERVLSIMWAKGYSAGNPLP